MIDINTINRKMQTIIASVGESDDNFTNNLDNIRTNPSRCRELFCLCSTQKQSEISFKNQILIREIYVYASQYKYDIDYYDVICLCLMFISFNNSDYWSGVRMCEEIIEITKSDILREEMLDLRMDANNSAKRLSLDGYTEDALKYFSNPNEFETFWIMCKKRRSDISVDVISLSSHNIQLKLNAKGSHFVCGVQGDFAVDYSDGILLLDFEGVEEYSNRKYGKMSHTSYPKFRIYEQKNYLFFEAYDFFNPDFFLKIKSKKVIVSKEINTPLFRK